MKNTVINIFKLTGVYVGLIIGAGFASGREIMTFFTGYGRIWPLGIITAGILFAVLGYIITDIVDKDNISSYSRFISRIMGEKTAGITEAVSGIFLCVLFFAMISASGSLAYEAFGISRMHGSMAMAAVCFLIFVRGMDGVIKVNAVLSPVMVIGAVLVCACYCLTGGKAVFMVCGGNVKMPCLIFLSALVYVSYNIITAVSVFVGTRDIIKEDKRVKISGVLGGIFLCVMGIMLGAVMFLGGEKLYGYDIPMLAAIGGTGTAMGYIYVLVLIGAIITTAAGNGYGAIMWAEDRTGIKPIIIKIFMCASSVLFSLLGFARFTDSIYPLFGFLGLIEIFCIFKYYLRKI